MNENIQFSVSFIADFALSVLLNKNKIKIHSIYEKTINLITGGKLLALQKKGSEISPISIISDAENFDIKSDCMVYISGKNIVFKDNIKETAFDFSESTVINTNLNQSFCDFEKIKSAIHFSNCSGFRLIFFDDYKSSDDFFVLSAAKNIIDDCTTFFNFEDYKKASSTLSKLIGLGTGLTPSGDDFLCGVLAGIKFCSLENHIFFAYLKQAIKNNLSRTNDISKAFLECALSGHFSKSVMDIPKSSAENIYKSFSLIGHSSGFDTLCGIYYIMKVVKSKKDA